MIDPAPELIPEKIYILVVDDEEVIREMLQEAIGYAGYNCSIAENGTRALEILKKERVDVVITDIKMPGISGIELLREVKENHEADVIVMTGFIEDFTYEKIIHLGASDFIGKPFRNKELLVRLKRVLKERNLLVERMRIHQQLLDSMSELQDAHEAVHDAYLDTIKRLAIAAEYKDEETGEHISRISSYCELIALNLGLPRSMVENIRYASPMHDVGKIGIPDKILLKPGKLTAQELEIIKSHTTIGENILADSSAEILQYAHQIAGSHHERWDGRGYPRGLAGEAIPITGRIVGIADVFDALTSARPYKEPYPAEVAFEIIRQDRGKHFDPAVADAFFKDREKVICILQNMNPTCPIQHIKPFQWSDREEGTLSIC